MRARPFHLAAVALLAAACSSATGVAELDAARLRWEREGPASYSMTVFRSCECLPEMTGPVVVTVEDGVVVSRHYPATGAAVAPSLADAFPSVDGLFEKIEAARRRGVARFEVRYDPTFGHPVDIAIDVDAMMADEEILYTITDLRPR